MPSADLTRAIAATAELCGRTFSPAAARVFASDLEGYPEPAVLAALTRCRKEVKGLLTVAEVIARIDDGRPGVEQAWAMMPHSEADSIVWTAEMAHAWGVASPLLQTGDKVGARMAFKEAYTKAVSDARDAKRPARWMPSLGRDVAGRQAALIEAVQHGRISLNAAVPLLPDEAARELVRASGASHHPLLAPPSTEGKARLKTLLLTLKPKTLTTTE
jgi:hypothetical protein